MSFSSPYHLKNYVYFAMAFSFLVELVNMRLRKGRPVHLHNRPHLESSARQEAAKAS